VRGRENGNGRFPHFLRGNGRGEGGTKGREGREGEVASWLFWERVDAPEGQATGRECGKISPPWYTAIKPEAD